jgi:group I intron endonuclease
MTYLLYRATNKENGKCYIGITGRTIEIRKRRHFWTARSGGGSIFGSAIRKYGAAAFEFKALVKCPDLAYANALERAAISLYRPEYNLTAGGEGVLKYRLSDEAKAKISLIQKGNSHWLGKRHSAETRKKMSAARQSFWERTPHSRKNYVKKNGPKRGRQIIHNGVLYESIAHAARANGLTRDQLRIALRSTKSKGFINGQQFCYYVQNQASKGQ